MKMYLRDVEVDAEFVPRQPDEKIKEWLGDQLVSWEADTLTVEISEGSVMEAPPGWLLVSWPDGWFSISSPGTAQRLFEPASTGE